MNRIEATDNRVMGKFPWTQSTNFRDVSMIGRSVEEAIKISPLNFTVRKEPLFLQNGTQIAGSAVVRDDTNVIISDYIGPETELVQNIEKFKQFQPYLDKKEATLLHAGAMQGGRITAIIARLDEDTEREVVKGDIVAKYLLITDAFGGLSLRYQLLAARLICGNGMIATEARFTQKMRHSKRIHKQLQIATDNLTLWNSGFNETFEQYKQLAAKDVKTESNLVNYFAQVMNFEEKPDSGFITRQKNTLDALIKNFNNSKYNGEGHTYWQGYNAITALVNHQLGRSTETSLVSNFYGNGHSIMSRALEIGLEFASKS